MGSRVVFLVAFLLIAAAAFAQSNGSSNQTTCENVHCQKTATCDESNNIVQYTNGACSSGVCSFTPFLLSCGNMTTACSDGSVATCARTCSPVSNGAICNDCVPSCGSACTNECVAGTTRCTTSLQETCGNYDSDSCTEWGNNVYCQKNPTCEGNAIVSYGGSCSTGVCTYSPYPISCGNMSVTCNDGSVATCARTCSATSNGATCGDCTPTCGSLTMNTTNTTQYVCPAIYIEPPACTGTLKPIFDDHRCLVRYECLPACPPVAMPSCAPGSTLVKEYRDQCLFYTCQQNNGTCGNAVCEGIESAASCPRDCSTCMLDSDCVVFQSVPAMAGRCVEGRCLYTYDVCPALTVTSCPIGSYLKTSRSENGCPVSECVRTCANVPPKPACEPRYGYAIKTEAHRDDAGCIISYSCNYVPSNEPLFRSAFWSCADGSRGGSQEGTMCRTGSQWKSAALEFCRNHCTTLLEPTSVQTVTAVTGRMTDAAVTTTSASGGGGSGSSISYQTIAVTSGDGEGSVIAYPMKCGVNEFVLGESCESCGNNICETGETEYCLRDCEATTTRGVCGDLVCDSSETTERCPQDCKIPGTVCPATRTCADGTIRACKLDGTRCGCETCPITNLPDFCRQETNDQGFMIVRCERTDCRVIGERDKVACLEKGGYPLVMDSANQNQCPSFECRFEKPGFLAPRTCLAPDQFKEKLSRCEALGLHASVVIENGCEVPRCVDQKETCQDISGESRATHEQECRAQGGTLTKTVNSKGCTELICATENTCQRDLPVDAYRACSAKGGEIAVKRSENGCVVFADCVHKGSIDTEPVQKVAELDASELLQLALKLERLRVELDTLSGETRRIADYYQSKGSNEAERYNRIADMFATATRKIDELKERVRNKIDHLSQDDLKQIRQDIQYIKKVIIKDIAFLLLSNGNDVKEIKEGGVNDCGTDSSCFEEAFRLCKPVTFQPEGSSGPLVTIGGLADGKCVLRAVMSTASGQLDMRCRVEAYALGLGRPEETILPTCEGPLVAYIATHPGSTATTTTDSSTAASNP